MKHKQVEIIKKLMIELMIQMKSVIFENGVEFIKANVAEDAISAIQLATLKSIVSTGYERTLESNPELQKRVAELFKSIDEFVGEDALKP